MKDTIRILLYALLVLLVGAIIYMIYKRSKTPVDDIMPTTEMADSLFMDPQHTEGTALTAEDSMILDLTGQLPAQVGAPADVTKDNNAQPSSSVDYTQKAAPIEKEAAVNSTPKEQKPVATTAKATESKTMATKTANHSTETRAGNSKTSVKTKSAAPKASSSKAAETSKGFFVVCGSFIKPENADDQVKKLKKMGYSGAQRKVFGSSEYYSAVAGSYSNRSEAEKAVQKLEAKGEKAFLKAK